MTLVVNLYAGPGAGKSTTAALVFAMLKQAHINVEIAHEYAKELTWEERPRTIRFQPYVTAKQMWRVHRLLGQVDVVVTDSPIILSTVYKGEGYTPAFEDFVVDTYSRWHNLNYFLKRFGAGYQYQTKGRNQTEEEALVLDGFILGTLRRLKLPYKEVSGRGMGASLIAADVLRCLRET